jgi:hypothetical protein
MTISTGSGGALCAGAAAAVAAGVKADLPNTEADVTPAACAAESTSRNVCFLAHGQQSERTDVLPER